MFGAQEEVDLMPGRRTLSDDQVTRLAVNVRERLEDIGDPRIRAPEANEFRAERQVSPVSDTPFVSDLEVDIDVGSTIITLLVMEGSRLPTDHAAANDLAKCMVKHVLLARADREGIEALKSAEKALAAMIKRENSTLRILSVRYRPAQMANPEALLRRSIWVKVGMLDNMLRPRIETIEGASVRSIRRQLRLLDGEDRKRRATLARLHSSDGVIEIEAMAEYAITSAGRDIAEVVGKLSEDQQAQPEVLLSHTRGSARLSVRARHGRIVLDATFPQCWLSTTHSLIVLEAFPDMVLSSLPGRHLRDVIDHPMLDADTEIVAADRQSDDLTEIHLLERVRPVLRSEIGKHRD